MATALVRGSIERRLSEQAASMIPGAIEAVLTWHLRVRERRALAALDDRMLPDIGISRADVEFECSKPAWRR